MDVFESYRLMRSYGNPPAKATLKTLAFVLGYHVRLRPHHWL